MGCKNAREGTRRIYRRAVYRTVLWSCRWRLDLAVRDILAVALLGPHNLLCPIILANKAQFLRKELGQRKTFRDWVDGTILKPCIMLVQEPMLIATTVYISVVFVYGCMYLIFEAYPVVFTQEHHLDAGVSGMVYIPIAGGSLTGFFTVRSQFPQ